MTIVPVTSLYKINNTDEWFEMKRKTTKTLNDIQIQ